MVRVKHKNKIFVRFFQGAVNFTRFRTGQTYKLQPNRTISFCALSKRRYSRII